MQIDRATKRATDEEFFGLRDGEGPGRVAFLNTTRLARPDDKLFGGTAVGASIAAMERVTGRDIVWATTQFVSTVDVGSTIECHVEILAAGRRTSQVRLTATVAGEVIFATLGATAEPKADGLRRDLERRPAMEPPTTGRPVFRAEDGHKGWHTIVELRRGVPADPDAIDPSHLLLWVRMRDSRPMTPGRLAFVSDLVPIAVARACGSSGAGISLDNTLRMGELVATEWVLLDLRPHLASGGYGHGMAVLWAEDGTLLGVASQSASMLLLPWDPLEKLPGT